MSNNGAGHAVAAIFHELHEEYFRRTGRPEDQQFILDLAKTLWTAQWKCGIDYDTYDICEYSDKTFDVLVDLQLARKLPNPEEPDPEYWDRIFYGDSDWRE